MRRLPGVRKVFVGSGIRHDLILADNRRGRSYLRTLLQHHASGQLKIAPEHIQPEVLALMGKPGRRSLEEFLALFQEVRHECAARVFLTYYFMAAHPGCRAADMQALRRFAQGKLHLLPEQVQIFTPTPGTFSSLMYFTETDPFSGAALFVEKTGTGKQQQKETLRASPKGKRKR